MPNPSFPIDPALPACFARRSLHRGRPAFTLVEMVIVIAVVMVLFALSFPVISSVRKKTGGATCVTNLRALFMAGLAYGADHDGKLPSTSLYNSANHSKPGVQDYLSGGRYNSAYRCPSLKEYPFSPAYLLPGSDLKGCTYTVSLATSSNANGGTYTLDYFRRIEKPVGTAWIMDGAWNVSYFDSVISPNGLQAGLSRLQFPHGDRQNVIFADGHVESLQESEIPTDPNATFWTGL